MVTCVGTETGAVRTSNVAPVPPAGMKTVAGSVITVLSPFTSATSTPPGGAGLNSVESGASGWRRGGAEPNAPEDGEQTERVLLPAKAVGGADGTDRGARHQIGRAHV